jgi:hypothetical protein
LQQQIRETGRVKHRSSGRSFKETLPCCFCRIGGEVAPADELLWNGRQTPKNVENRMVSTIDVLLEKWKDLLGIDSAQNVPNPFPQLAITHLPQTYEKGDLPRIFQVLKKPYQSQTRGSLCVTNGALDDGEIRMVQRNGELLSKGAFEKRLENFLAITPIRNTQ